jgi:hypothetical protein
MITVSHLALLTEALQPDEEEQKTGAGCTGTRPAGEEYVSE